jgi:hypothetical protein
MLGTSQLSIESAKPFANLVMALASYTPAQSLVQLSQSPLYHYQYSSITDAIHALARDGPHAQQVLDTLQKLWIKALPQPLNPIIRINADTTPVPKPWSPCLAQRTFIHVPNSVIATNKPLSIGYALSCVTLQEQANWQLPLTMQRVATDQTPTQTLLAQLTQLFGQAGLGLGQASLVINRLDRAYGQPAYLAPSYAHANLVNIVRLRQGQKVWLAQPRSQTGGRPALYAPQPHYLLACSRQLTYHRQGQAYEKEQRSLFEQAPHEQLELGQYTAKKRRLRLQLYGWKNVLFRSKQGHSMSDKPVDIVAVRTYDALTNELVYDQPLFLCVSGSKKDELSLGQILEEYQGRYGIEGFFRFSKQHLFLGRFQTPSLQHLDNFLLVLQTAVWLLYGVAQAGSYQPAKWRKQELRGSCRGVLSLSEAYYSAERLLLSFDLRAFRAKKCSKGKGRQRGQKQGLRVRYGVIRKAKAAPS